MLLRLSIVGLFGYGSQLSLLCGAFAYYGVAVLDAVDGPLARLTGRATEFGRYYDHVTDLLGDFLILLALGYGQGIFPQPILIAMLFMHVAESYISYVTNQALSARPRGDGGAREEQCGIIATFARYKQFFFRNNLKSFLTFPDYAMLTFVVFPLADRAAQGLYWGFFLLLMTTSYTILSTFMSLHSSVTKFP